MIEEYQHPNTTENQQSEAPRLCYTDQALWRQLAEAETVEAFCHSWLMLQCSMIDSVNSGVVVLGPPDEGPFSPTAFWPRVAKNRQHLIRITERALKEQKGVVMKSDTDEKATGSDKSPFYMAYPVRINGAFHGVAALELTPRSQIQLQSSMRQLQWGVTWLENWILLQDAERDAFTKERLITALDLSAVILQEGHFKAAATTFVTVLATRLDCDRVSIGFVKGKQSKVHALSHSAQFGKQMNLIRAIGAAMDECIDQQEVLLYPETREQSKYILSAHAELARQQGNSALCTVPFTDRDGNGYGAVTLERSVPQPFDAKTVEMCDCVAALVGPILEEKRKNDQLLIKKVWEAFSLQLAKVIGKGHVGIKLALIITVAVVLFFTFAMGDYRVTAETTLEGTVQRAVSAPYDGYIYEAYVRAGDVIKDKQIMCRLDDRDLRLERLKWVSQEQKHLREFRQAMAERDRAKMKILKEQVNQAEAEIALLDEQLARIKLKAPFNGIVVSGDLSQSLGAPVERGQVLFEVAPLDAYRLILQVNERDIGHIEVGQRGNVMLNALPKADFPIRVEKITPVSTAEEGLNYFKVEAQLEEISEHLRPGMEGVSKVYVGRRKLIWILTHDLIDWVRLWVWSWWP